MVSQQTLHSGALGQAMVSIAVVDGAVIKLCENVASEKRWPALTDSGLRRRLLKVMGAFRVPRMLVESQKPAVVFRALVASREVKVLAVVVFVWGCEKMLWESKMQSGESGGGV